MRQSGHSGDAKGIRKNIDRKTNISAFIDTQTAAATSETTLLSDFKQDTSASKVYLAGREFLNEEGQTSIPSLVGKIKQQINTDPTYCPEYPSPLGLTEFTRRATEVALGDNSRAVVENRVLGVQTVGFTGAVRLGAELLRHWYKVRAAWCGPVYLSSPCDDSLAVTFQAAGIQDIRHYYYWDTERQGVCLEKLLADLERAPEHSVVVLSASAHRPTGADLSQKNWGHITQLMLKRRLFPFILLPVQGLCYGELQRDAWPVQYCEALGMELLCAQSFSHSFGLYGEHVGHLVCVLKQNCVQLAVRSQAEKLVRALWAQPSAGGARVVAAVLGNPAHLEEWRAGVKHMLERCMLVREKLRERLRLLGTPGCWDHLIEQAQQVEFLCKRRHIYLLRNGCLNVSAINTNNLDYIAQSIYQTVTSPH